MPLVTSPDLQRYWFQGENELSSEKHFLVDRISLAAASGQQSFTLPDYVLSIRRVTWGGWKLDPLPQRNQREVFQGAQQEGFPYWYIYNNIGANLINLFPEPQNSYNVVNNVWGSDIPNGFIVEFFRAADNETFIIVQCLRQQMLKLYAAYRVYSKDGPSINLKLAQYYKQRWEMMKAQFVELVEELYTLPRKLMINEVVSSNYFPGEPVLPIDQFGISVDEGY